MEFNLVNKRASIAPSGVHNQLIRISTGRHSKRDIVRVSLAQSILEQCNIRVGDPVQLCSDGTKVHLKLAKDGMGWKVMGKGRPYVVIPAPTDVIDYLNSVRAVEVSTSKQRNEVSFKVVKNG